MFNKLKRKHAHFKIYSQTGEGAALIIEIKMLEQELTDNMLSAGPVSAVVVALPVCRLTGTMLTCRHTTTTWCIALDYISIQPLTSS